MYCIILFNSSDMHHGYQKYVCVTCNRWKSQIMSRKMGKNANKMAKKKLQQVTLPTCSAMYLNASPWMHPVYLLLNDLPILFCFQHLSYLNNTIVYSNGNLFCKVIHFLDWNCHFCLFGPLSSFSGCWQAWQADKLGPNIMDLCIVRIYGVQLT